MPIISTPPTKLINMKIWEDNNLRIESLSGAESKKYFEDFARLRIEIFREYPYLYEGTVENERNYIENYLSNPQSRIFVLFDGDKICGMLTTVPMSGEYQDIIASFEKTGLKSSESFYLGDMILQKEYRNRKLFPIFFNAALEHAKCKGFKTLSLMCIVCKDADWGRPAEFRDVVRLCEKIGFTKIDGGVIELKWASLAKGGEQKTHTLQLYQMQL